MNSIKDVLLIIIIGSLLGMGVNAARVSLGNGGLSWKTPWPDNRQKVQLEIPPSYQPGDSLLSVEEAYGLYLDGETLFLDSREPEEYQEGHIKGAVNFPFEQWDAYWDSVKPHLDPDREIVAYCGGLDCELSLFLARELQQLGYNKSYIFFGGWLKWQEAKLPIEVSGGEESSEE